MQARLTASLVRNLTQQLPPSRETVVFDTLLPRFALRVRPPPAPGQPWPALYFVRYVAPDGRERKLKIGSPTTMDLDAARKAARAVLAIVDRGGDPAALKAAQRARISVQQAAEAYIASREFQAHAETTRATDQATLRLHIAHHLGHLPLADINLPRARQLRRAIAEDQRTNSRRRRLGGAGAATKALGLLTAMLSWCVAEGMLERHPLRGVLRLPASSTRETVITDADEYGRLFSAMDNMVTEGNLRPAVQAFITVAALTGMRRGELQGLRWGDVDLGERRIKLRGSKGAKLARSGPKIEFVSLPPFAAAALATIRLEDATDDEPVFPHRTGRRIFVNADWCRVRARAGLPADLTLHGLRHSAGTVAILAGLSGPETQKLLRHRSPGVTARYIHLAENLRLQDRALGHLAPPMPARKVGSR